MARNGSGTYSLPSGNPVVTGDAIEATWANATLSDIATALTQSLSKDGQTSMTGNLPMGGYKITGLGTPTVSTDAATKAYTDAAVSGVGYLAANQTWTGLNTFSRGTGGSTNAIAAFLPADYGTGVHGLWVYNNGVPGTVRLLAYDGSSSGAQLTFGAGLQVGSPTGGDLGANTLNVAGAIKQDNVAVLLEDAIGSTVQAYSAELVTLAATGAANIPTLTGSNTLTNKTLHGAAIKDGVGSSTYMSTIGALTNIKGVDLEVSYVYKVNGTQVLGPRKTGWSTGTGGISRASFDTATITTEQLAERFRAWLIDSESHGLTGT